VNTVGLRQAPMRILESKTTKRLPCVEPEL
jgi:hypothetical protein